MYDLNGMVALVTGAAGKRGEGRAIALRLAREGVDVVVNDISQFGVRHTDDDRMEDWNGLRSVEAEIRSLGRKSLAIEADVSSGEQVEEMVKQCMAEFGRIDILVNNAAIVGPGSTPALQVPEADWYRLLATNTMGTYLCATAVAKRMIERQQGGKIINNASVVGKYAGASGAGAHPPLAPYVVSKFGVVAVTQLLALELAKHKIRVNAICDGYIATDLSMGAPIRSDMRQGVSLEEATAKAYAKVLPLIPLGRAGQPQDVANVVAFLASDQSDYITGETINVTGGFFML